MTHTPIRPQRLPQTARTTLAIAACLFFAAAATGCQKMALMTREAFGSEKREVLVDRVEDARDSQEAAKEQFKSALEEFTAVTNFSGGELEEIYQRLSDAYERSEKRADDVRTRIEKVEYVAEALFDEWEEELDEYESVKYRQASEAQLDKTRQRYGQLIRAMRKAESRITPVLSAFRDQVLFLKHNLNAQAIASLQSELDDVESNIATLIKEMEESINEANAFIESMGKTS